MIYIYIYIQHAKPHILQSRNIIDHTPAQCTRHWDLSEISGDVTDASLWHTWLEHQIYLFNNFYYQATTLPQAAAQVTETVNNV